MLSRLGEHSKRAGLQVMIGIEGGHQLGSMRHPSPGFMELS